ncbi:MAG: hypothetical protein AAF465_13445, partial [Pseudomonadota bacterium]
MKDLIPLWLIHKSGEKPSDSENDNNGWIAGLFLIAAFFAGEYSYSFAVAQGWSSGIVYTTATAGTIVGGILGAIVGYFALKLIGIALAIGLVVLIGYGSNFMQKLLDPNEFSILQTSMFASINNVDEDLLVWA